MPDTKSNPILTMQVRFPTDGLLQTVEADPYSTRSLCFEEELAVLFQQPLNAVVFIKEPETTEYQLGPQTAARLRALKIQGETAIPFQTIESPRSIRKLLPSAGCHLLVRGCRCNNSHNIGAELIITKYQRIYDAGASLILFEIPVWDRTGVLISPEKLEESVNLLCIFIRILMKVDSLFPDFI